MAYLAAAEFVVVGVGAGVVQDRGAGLHVQGVDEAVVVDEPGVDGFGFAGLASSGERIPPCGVPVTVSSATPTSVRTPAFKKAFTSASTRLSAIRAAPGPSRPDARSRTPANGRHPAGPRRRTGSA